MDFTLILFFAFIGGVILNIMPCVLPVLSIKVLSIVKYSNLSKTKIRLSFLATTLGIICSFIILALIVVYFKKVGMQVGWGFQFQQPLFLISIILILFLFSINQLGFFELNLPANVLNKINKSVDNSYSFKNSFLLGMFASLMATPCSAPYLGTAIGFALTASSFDIFLIFLFIGIGLSFPYLLFLASPNFIKIFPKPGIWMLIVKKAMALLLLASVIWLLFVLKKQIDMNTFYVIIGILITIFSIFFIKLNINYFNYFRNFVVIIFCFIAIYVISTASKNNAAYIASNNWLEFNEKKINELKKNNVIFVDVTATWCITCKFNKLNVLDTKEIESLFQKNNVIKFRADYTNPSQEIKQYLKKYNRNGIPFNIVYGPNALDGVLLSELLSKQAVINAVEKSVKKAK